MNCKKLIRNFIIGSAAFFALCALAVWFIDPFFHYHEPFGGLKKVLTEKEYQCIGSIRNFEYDAVIAGSSVCENYNNSWFDEKFDVKSIKAIRSYGANADLCWFLKEGFKNHDLKYVFYNIDPGTLVGGTGLTFEETGCPMYLYDNNPITDIEYLLNKDVILEKIPYMVSKSFLDDYDEGESYNWGQWKSFNSEQTLSLYIRKKNIAAMNNPDCYAKECEGNVALLEELVASHPDTQFVFFFSPYSFIWWDNIYRYGDTDAYIRNMKVCCETLLEYENVRVFYFLTDEEVVTNLDNYMDVLHFAPEINKRIVDMISEGKFEVTKDNVDIIFEQSKEFANKAVNELIVPFEDDIKVEYE